MVPCGMEEQEKEKEKKTVPPPTIKNSPPAKPPTTTADAAPEPENKEKAKDAEPTDEIVAESENAIGEEAELGNRILGGLLDGFLCGVVIFLLTLILPGFLDGLARLLWIPYFLLRDSLPFLDGQSIGKKVVGTKAVREDGTPLTGDFKTGAIRNVWMLLPFVEPLVLIVRKDKPESGRRLGDDFAKTKVINVD